MMPSGDYLVLTAMLIMSPSGAMMSAYFQGWYLFTQLVLRLMSYLIRHLSVMLHGLVAICISFWIRTKTMYSSLKTPQTQQHLQFILVRYFKQVKALGLIILAVLPYMTGLLVASLVNLLYWIIASLIEGYKNGRKQ